MYEQCVRTKMTRQRDLDLFHLTYLPSLVNISMASATIHLSIAGTQNTVNSLLIE